MKRREPLQPKVELSAFHSAPSDYAKNRMLLDWLSYDETRAQLYACVNSRTDATPGILKFPSLARYEPVPTLVPSAPEAGYRYAYLLTSPEAVEQALRDDVRFSNSPYAALGTGGFMLALDTGDADQKLRHDQQVAAAGRAFPTSGGAAIHNLCNYAFEAALPTALARSEFDLAQLAEEVAVRFCSALFGYAASDYLLLEDALRRGYQALNYQILGRHFLTQPLLLPEAKASMGKLLARTMTLIDEYQQEQADVPEDIEGESVAGLHRQERVMCKLAVDATSGLTGEERAVLTVGSMVGIVGNVQASVCIALRALFEVAPPTTTTTTTAAAAAAAAAADRLQQALKAAGQAAGGQPLWAHLLAGLQANPPVAFLPRRARSPLTFGGVAIPEDADCILALGGGTGAQQPQQQNGNAVHPLVFGLDSPPADRGLHHCIGKYLAEPLIQRICAGVLRLPSVAEQLDAHDGLPVGLEKQWGFRCVSYPMRHRRDVRCVQQSLNVVMRIKSPIATNAEALRNVIRSGASRIERVLRESRHVHFAWFEFIEADTRLVLHTVYDGDFDAYIQHFALVVGDVFDRLFRHIEDAPPMPVKEFPGEFVALIRRFNRPPAMGFFFSAYPRLAAAEIERWSRGR